MGESIEVFIITPDGGPGLSTPALSRKTLPARANELGCQLFTHPTIGGNPVELCAVENPPRECEEKGVCYIFADTEAAKGFVCQSTEDTQAVWEHIFTLYERCEKWK
jgi:hypothetical protein